MPLKEPFETAKRRANVSNTVYVELVIEGGILGFGASTPLAYVTGETVQSVAADVERAAQAIVGQDVSAFLTLGARLAEALPASPSARAGVEMAIIDAAGKLAGKPSYVLLGGTSRSIETDLTIPVVPPAHAVELTRHAGALGFRRFKVKVSGTDPDQDIARAVAITEAVPGSCLIVDANQGFAPRDAVDFMERLVAWGVEVVLFEQPVDAGDIDGLVYVTERLQVPVFADESAQTPEDVIRLAERRAVRGINVKIMKSGVFGALEIARICAQYGLDLMLGCMIEPRVGIAAALQVACAASGFRHFDLDGDLLLADSGSGGFHRAGAMLRPTESSGLGL